VWEVGWVVVLNLKKPILQGGTEAKAKRFSICEIGSLDEVVPSQLRNTLDRLFGGFWHGAGSYFVRFKVSAKTFDKIRNARDRLRAV
jgi:hypothetical protein